MWHSQSDTDILDFALLWEPLGGPAPENIAAAFSIDIGEYHHRLRAATRLQLTRLQQCVVSPQHIYAPSAIAVLIEMHCKSASYTTSRPEFDTTTALLDAVPL